MRQFKDLTVDMMHANRDRDGELRPPPRRPLSAETLHDSDASIRPPTERDLGLKSEW